MTIDPDVYRGFQVNVEMAGGYFLPSYHDPIRHAEDCWTRMPTCTAERKDDAISKAHDAIDKLIAGEMARTIGQMFDAGVKIAI